MYNRRYIIPGIVLFVVLFTAPFWTNILSHRYERPVLSPAAQGTECIIPVETMRAEHMRILNEWRDAALREGRRTFVAPDGKVWEASLQNTCMKCHDNKEQFCDTCHNSNSVTPYCWDCHIAPAKADAKKAEGK